MDKRSNNQTLMELPTKIVKATEVNPRNLVIFSKPKVGKTALVAQLNDCLLLDFEKGSDFVDALKVKIGSLKDLKELGTLVKERDKLYKYVVIDTATALEDLAEIRAEQLYSNTPMGKNWKTVGKKTYSSIRNLPQGGGYQYLRDAYVELVNYISTFAERLIILAHVKHSSIDKDGTQVNSMDLYLTGKIKQITASGSDSIGYMYRKGNENILSFKTKEDIICGARPKHLQNAEIVISEVGEDGELITHWDKIFIN